MTPYILKMGDVSKEVIEVFKDIQQVVSFMPDVILKDSEGRTSEVSCHMLTRALALSFPVQYQDGHFNNYRHSWLVSDEVIIDPYPWACASGPLLVLGNGRMGRFMTPWRTLYVPLEPFAFTRMKQFRDDVEKVSAAVEQVLQQLKAVTVR